MSPRPDEHEPYSLDLMPVEHLKLSAQSIGELVNVVSVYFSFLHLPAVTGAADSLKTPVNSKSRGTTLKRRANIAR